MTTPPSNLLFVGGYISIRASLTSFSYNEFDTSCRNRVLASAASPTDVGNMPQLPQSCFCFGGLTHGRGEHATTCSEFTITPLSPTDVGTMAGSIDRIWESLRQYKQSSCHTSALSIFRNNPNFFSAEMANTEWTGRY